MNQRSLSFEEPIGLDADERQPVSVAAGQTRQLAAEIAEGEIGTAQHHNEATESEASSGQSSPTESDQENDPVHHTGEVGTPQEQNSLGNPAQLEAAMEDVINKISGCYALMEQFPEQQMRYDAKVMELEHEYGKIGLIKSLTIGLSVCGSRSQAKDHSERTVRRCARPA